MVNFKMLESSYRVTCLWRPLHRHVCVEVLSIWALPGSLRHMSVGLMLFLTRTQMSAAMSMVPSSRSPG